MSHASYESLNADRIKSAMSATGQIALHHLALYQQLDSTNSELQRQAANGAPSGTACLADCQTAGRGRRGHIWHSPPAVNLYLSLLWRYSLPPAALAGTSLAVGAVVAEVLQAAGGNDLHLKWPNDVLWRGRKVAGLLLEVSGNSQGSSFLIVGIGLNVHMTAAVDNEITQPWIALADIVERPLNRNQIAGQLLDALINALECYGREGVAPFLTRWRQFDAWIGHPVQLICANQIINGIHHGIAEDGALLLKTANGMRTFHAGEVSLRKQ